MQGQTLYDFLVERMPELLQHIAEHLMLTTVSVMCAVVLGLAIAILAFEKKSLRGPITTIVGILQTIPSLALLVMLMIAFGKIGVLPALVALILYALLPIVRNTLIGLDSTADATMEAARGIGMNKFQQLWYVRFPIATPAILAGIRTATVVCVGIATLSAFIGAGGLGEFINRGLALSSPRLIMLGAIPSGLLAIICDLALGCAEWGFRPVRQDDKPLNLRQQRLRRRLAATFPVLLFVFSLVFYALEHPQTASDNRIRIGSKHFTEQLILAELMAQVIEGNTRLIVERKFDLGGTAVCHGALIRGEIDTYPEYTGTSLTSILNINEVVEPDAVLGIVSKKYANDFKIKWLKPFGFNNTWSLICNKSNRWKKISDLRNDQSNITIGVPAEFAERQDGFIGLRKKYGLDFSQVKDIDTNIAYKALQQKELDVAAGNATDGHVQAYDLRLLEDDLHFFPPYLAAPVVRMSVLEKHPELESALNKLGNQIDDSVMQSLNYKVDGLGQSPAFVAKEYLASARRTVPSAAEAASVQH
ncbi:MAG: glycine betaine ABC transporter substrate-binding protein [Candidatus Obscuribacterales bacterium]|nr:glycine betaine ABC transporter substrate-binding protein [Candidatus Obscuribacterales bacterium]